MIPRYLINNSMKTSAKKLIPPISTIQVRNELSKFVFFNNRSEKKRKNEEEEEKT